MVGAAAGADAAGAHITVEIGEGDYVITVFEAQGGRESRGSCSPIFRVFLKLFDRTQQMNVVQ